MTIMYADAEQNGNGGIDSWTTEIENSSRDEIISIQFINQIDYRPTFDASSESEATAPYLHFINDDSPSKP